MLFALACLCSLLPTSSSADQFRIYIQRPGNPDRQLSTVRASDALTSGTLDFYSDDLLTSGTIELTGQDTFNIGGSPYPPPTPTLQEVTTAGATTNVFSTFTSTSGTVDGTTGLSLSGTKIRGGSLYGMASTPASGAGTATAAVMAYSGSGGGPIPLRVESTSSYLGEHIRVGVADGISTIRLFAVENDGGVTASGQSAFDMATFAGNAEFDGGVLMSGISSVTPVGVLVINSSDEVGVVTELPLSRGGTGTSLGNGTSGQVITSNADGTVSWGTPATIPSGANPTALVDGTVVNGAATTYMRSDAAPRLANPFTPSGAVQTIAGSVIVQTDATVDGSYTLGDGVADTGVLNGDITLNTGSGDTLVIESSTPTIANVPFDTGTPSVALDGFLVRADTTDRIRGLDAAASRVALGLGTAALINTPVTVPNGGTGLTTITSNGVTYGAGASNLAVTAAGSAGDILFAGPTPAFGKTGTGAYTFNNAVSGQTAFDINVTSDSQIGIDIDADADLGNTGITVLTNDGIAGRFEDPSSVSLQADLRSASTYTFNVTPGSAYVYAGGTSVAAGAVSRIGGTFSRNATATGNVGSGEDILHTITAPANMVDGTGQRLRITAVGTYAANANNKNLRVRLNTAAGTSLFATGALAVNGGDWRLVVEVMRTATTTGEFATRLDCEDSTITQAVSFDYISTAVTWSNANTIDITGEATSNNDIVCEWSSAEWLP